MASYEDSNHPGHNPKKVVRRTEVFSAHHPLIPRRYVPPWQLDMKNRRNIGKNALLGNAQDVWKGHTSYFYCGRERIQATNHRLYKSILNYSRTLYPIDSHLSRYNSGLMKMISALPDPPQ